MQENKLNTSKKLLGIFSLVMITVGSVDSIRNLPTIALFGTNILFFFGAATLFFLLPSTIVAAELASAWPEEGGIYCWVKSAFGKQLGFLAIWFQWTENLIWYPAILSFTASTVAYLIAPEMANNKAFLIIVILGIFWSTTFINLLNIKLSSMFSCFCTIAGLLFPMLMIIALGFTWYFSGKPLQIDFTPDYFLPPMHDAKMWTALTGIIMAFCGLEITTAHARDVKKPTATFPITFFISMIILLGTLIFGSLAIAIIIPAHKINLMLGLMQTFTTFLATYHLEWMIKIVGISIIIGSIGNLTNWIIAPSRGMAIAARDGHLPIHFAKVNRHQSPHNLLFFQAIVVTLLMFVFVFMPSVSASYWLLTVLTAQLYMLMYILMFAAAIALRFKHPHIHRPFRIPGKYLGMIIISTAGILGAGFAFSAGFIPPPDIQMGSNYKFDFILASGLILMSMPPFILYRLKIKNSN